MTTDLINHPLYLGLNPKIMNGEKLEALQTFTAEFNAKRFKTNLRKMLTEYLQTEAGSQFNDDLIYDMEQLFLLLDSLEEN